MGALALRPGDLREFDGQPCVRDVRLGEVLGYTDPKKVRAVIRRHNGELSDHGVLTQVGAKPIRGSRGGRPEVSYMLNEAQAVLVTMFSRTERAAEARRQIVSVFLTYRHGKLGVLSQFDSKPHDRLDDIVARLERLERAEALHPVRERTGFAMALAHIPLKKRHRYPAFWSDLEVRNRAVAWHRQMSVREAIERMDGELGRAPSKSALHRFWLWLDRETGRAIGRNDA